MKWSFPGYEVIKTRRHRWSMRGFLTEDEYYWWTSSMKDEVVKRYMIWSSPVIRDRGMRIIRTQIVGHQSHPLLSSSLTSFHFWGMEVTKMWSRTGHNSQVIRAILWNASERLCAMKCLSRSNRLTTCLHIRWWQTSFLHPLILSFSPCTRNSVVFQISLRLTDPYVTSEHLSSAFLLSVAFTHCPSCRSQNKLLAHKQQRQLQHHEVFLLSSFLSLVGHMFCGEVNIQSQHDKAWGRCMWVTRDWEMHASLHTGFPASDDLPPAADDGRSIRGMVSCNENRRPVHMISLSLSLSRTTRG